MGNIRKNVPTSGEEGKGRFKGMCFFFISPLQAWSGNPRARCAEWSAAWRTFKVGQVGELKYSCSDHAELISTSSDVGVES